MTAKVEVVVPKRGVVDVEELAAAMSGPPATAEPFAAPRLAFVGALSRTIQRDPYLRADAAMVALGYWLRPAALRQMAATFAAEQRPGVLRAPRGLVFQVAPSNVATLYAYSWVISFLTGNATVTRLSSRLPEGGRHLAAVIDQLLATSDFGALGATTAMVCYDHDDEVTGALSECADVRMIWGGDETVKTVRRAPLRPDATEVTFVDRFSFMLINSAAYLAMDDEGRHSVARAVFNDIYWFDQNACSSPRALVWCGTDEDARDARAVFYALLGNEVKRAAYTTSSGTFLAKLTDVYAHLADGEGTACSRLSNELVVVTLPPRALPPRGCVGLGTIYETTIDELGQLVPLVGRRDQTISHLGFQPPDLERLAKSLNGKGVDRLVPIGQALAFGRYWDGYDLFESLTRTVEIRLQ